MVLEAGGMLVVWYESLSEEVPSRSTSGEVVSRSHGIGVSRAPPRLSSLPREKLVVPFNKPPLALSEEFGREISGRGNMSAPLETVTTRSRARR